MILKNIHTLILLALALSLPAITGAQGIRVASGGYIRNNGGNMVVKGAVANGGTIVSLGVDNIRLSGDWQNNGTYTAAGGTVEMDGSSSQQIGGSAATGFNNLTVDNTSGIAATKNITVNGVLSLLHPNPSATAGVLDLGSNILFMGPSSATTGPGEASGTISRSSFVSGTAYSFGSQFTTLTFSAGGTMPSQVLLKNLPGTEVSWKTGAADRKYDLARVGGSGVTVTLKLHYLDSELKGIAEEDLISWDYHSDAYQVVMESHITSDRSAGDNWIATSLPVSDLATSFDTHPFALASAVFVVFEGGRGWRMISAPGQSSYAGLLDGFISQGMLNSTYPAKQPNFLWFDETDTMTTNMSWRTPSDVYETSVPGRGFYFYVFDTVSGSYSDELPRQMSAGGNTYLAGGFSFSGDHHPVSFSPRTGVQFSDGEADTTYYDKYVADQGWNLLGNPTESTLDWDAAGWTKTNIDNVIYIWDPAAEEFKVWNGTTGTLGSGLISPFQAFWVKANAEDPSLAFPGSAMTTGGAFLGGGDGLKSAEASAPMAIRLNLVTEGRQANAMVCFAEDGRTGPDQRDAYRLEPLSSSYVELFTLSSPNHYQPLVINNEPLEGDDYMIIPLYAENVSHGIATGVEFTLNWELPADWPADWAISLQDHSTESVVSMQDNQHYTFTLPETRSDLAANYPAGVPDLPALMVNPVSRQSLLKSSTENARFSIVIIKNTTEEPAYIAPSPRLMQNYPNPFTLSTTIRFSLPAATRVRISVYNMYGQLMDVAADRQYQAGIYTLDWSRGDLTPGFYFAEMLAGTTRQVIKMVISEQ